MATSPVLSRRTLGTELRRLREAAGVAVSRAAEELDCSVSKISRIETGLSTPRRPEIDTLLRLYSAPGSREELVHLAGEGKQAAWYDSYGDLLAPGSTLHRFIGLEAGASRLRQFSSGAVPGLLQTERYARAVITASQPTVSGEALETMIRMRLDRKSVLRREPDPLHIAALVDESVLRRSAHGPGVMRDQVQHLCGIVEDGSSTIEVRVLPFSVGLHGLLGGGFQILSFDHGESDVIFFEGQDGGGLQEKADIVRAHSDRLDAAWKQALEGRELLSFLREVADTYDE
ncbi:helix-turn-helix domain-containing protein [Pseudonocardia sp. DSM 110487]|uniref:helix-turn-helix domain-containing protein n=1 Tax=Pseudonocardia sp. DSM 110487 TaxID=2865833 RepID=UPI001C69AECA|nr:helix-turn-helix transcriptional regulator [Pseudonocardia sp. DSM 110487]QYN36098.1 helix-turn-helix domain-containing protein [Pseudonocardia sp. DSM 110487]